MSSWSTCLWTWLQEHHHPAVYYSLPFWLAVRQLAALHQRGQHSTALRQIAALQHITALQLKSVLKSVPISKWTLHTRESTLRSTNELLWHLQNCWSGSAQRGVEMWTSLLLGQYLQCRVEKGRWVGFHYFLCILTRRLSCHSHACKIRPAYEFSI